MSGSSGRPQSSVRRWWRPLRPGVCGVSAWARSRSRPVTITILWPVGGLTAWVKGVEMDPLWVLNLDDDLGTQEIAVRDNGQIKHFQHEGEDAMELTLVWEVEEEDDDDETQGHGESG